MDAREIADRRLATLGLTGDRRTGPADVVSQLVAVQSQDYGMAKWSVGQRRRTTATEVEDLVNDATVIRTHVLRPTWHFVHRTDLRWLLALTGPRVQVALSSACDRLGLDQPMRERSTDAFAAALRGGSHLTRTELTAVAAEAGVVTDGIGFGHLLMHAELEAVICSGPRRGKVATYALVDDRVGPSPGRSRSNAAVELAVRYFASHGPATVADFCWWSSLTVAEARGAVVAAGDQLETFQAGTRTYWAARGAAVRGPARTVHLLQKFDEFIVGYRESRDVVDTEGAGHVTGPDWGRDGNPVVVGGQVVGLWRRTTTGNAVTVEITVPVTVRAPDRDRLGVAAAALGQHLGRAVTLAFDSSG
jgi:Winged helix DNA-binding domain